MEERRLTEIEFVVRAIAKLKKDQYKGIHSVYSGFNKAFREYYGQDPVECTTRLAAEGRIVTRPVKGGVMIYLPGEAPPAKTSYSVLAKILADD
jgi:hypothetical protein